MNATGRRWLLADITVKVALRALLVFSVTHSDWARFSDKAMVARAVLYPVLVAIVPLLWWLRRRRDASVGYPAAAAALFTLPFLIDIAGNALDLYDRVNHFDDACHFANWALMCTALGLLLMKLPGMAAWNIAALCVGFGASVAILWEVGEYQTFILDTPEARTAYRDTIGDLALGWSGSVVAGLGVALTTWRRRRRGSAGPTVQPTLAKASPTMSRPSVSNSSPIDSGGRNRSTLP